MLQLSHICKSYHTGGFTQKALDNVSLTLRAHEFVAILGPSGSGKTTLLNVIGGLDQYDSGDLMVSGVSTKHYKSRDWDAYRNHTIGFVFQSYNLIEHQSVLANVELALTLSGTSRAERKRRARKALEAVGLGDQCHKRPNQLSGGQMQRVAIARALVNNPRILLADEPTGALDSETSLQVMDLLKEVAKDRLVVMVTHNASLAETYATRIVTLKDGRICEDTAPCSTPEPSPTLGERLKKASMRLQTAIGLSFSNLYTKKARTIMTAFAGSIGITGIALILSLANGVNTYINDIQKTTMVAYPITIQAETMDLSQLLSSDLMRIDGTISHDRDAVYANHQRIETVSTIMNSQAENNLTAFKRYLDDPSSDIHAYLDEGGIVYSYRVPFSVYARDPEGVLVDTERIQIVESDQPSSALSMGRGMMNNLGMMSATTSRYFTELRPGTDGNLVNSVVKDRYDMLYGRWPQAYDEVVLVVTLNNEIRSNVLYALGLLPASEYTQVMNQINRGEEVVMEAQSWSYEQICQQRFYLIPACDRYVMNEDGTFSDWNGSRATIEGQLDRAIELKISGIIRPNEGDTPAPIQAPIGYTSALTDYIMAYTQQSAVVTAQRATPNINVMNGFPFAVDDDAAKVESARNYLARMSDAEKAKLGRDMVEVFYGSDMGMVGSMSDKVLANLMDQYLKGKDSERSLIAIYDAYLSDGSLTENLNQFGAVSVDAPASINLYCDSFEDKDHISACIEAYNATASEADQLIYTDYIGLLLSNVTDIINVVFYVLIAFVAVSLVVSSIMIGIITYISVLERTKEIGILRAIGASKRNIRQVFNAESGIVGLASGVFGIGLTLMLLIPGNMVIHALAGTEDISAILPIDGAIALMVLSVILTLIAGILPARKAARKDPVAALRSE